MARNEICEGLLGWATHSDWRILEDLESLATDVVQLLLGRQRGGGWRKQTRLGGMTTRTENAWFSRGEVLVSGESRATNSWTKVDENVNPTEMCNLT